MFYQLRKTFPKYSLKYSEIFFGYSAHSLPWFILNQLESNRNGTVVFVVGLKQIVRYRKFKKIACENKRKIGNTVKKNL